MVAITGVARELLPRSRPPVPPGSPIVPVAVTGRRAPVTAPMDIAVARHPTLHGTAVATPGASSSCVRAGNGS